MLDTFRGFAAMVFPGGDESSLAQGEATDGPGGVEAGAAEAIIEGLAAREVIRFRGGSGGDAPTSSGTTLDH